VTAAMTGHRRHRGKHAHPLRHRGPGRFELLAMLAALMCAVLAALALPFGMGHL
jgi:hypothetical protein